MVRPRVQCVDGTSVSVQASAGHYCTPRDDDGPYTAVEVGYPEGNVPASWAEFSECDGIFAYLPVRLVWEYFNMHGGLASGELPPMTVDGKTAVVISYTPRRFKKISIFGRG